jgi:hypothetical protein
MSWLESGEQGGVVESNVESVQIPRFVVAVLVQRVFSAGSRAHSRQRINCFERAAQHSTQSFDQRRTIRRLAGIVERIWGLARLAEVSSVEGLPSSIYLEMRLTARHLYTKRELFLSGRGSGRWDRKTINISDDLRK